MMNKSGMEKKIKDPYFFDKKFCQLTGYRFIKRNEFECGLEESLSTKIENLVNAIGKCSCVPDSMGKKCIGEACLLRSRMIECDMSCGYGCQNRAISNLKPMNLQIDSAEFHNMAVITKKGIPRKAFVVEYVGKVQAGKVAENQRFAYPVSRNDLDLEMYVNSEREGNASRLMHHSAFPNCFIQPWIVERQVRLVVVSNDKIKNDDKLTMYFPQIMKAVRPSIIVSLNEH